MIYAVLANKITRCIFLCPCVFISRFGRDLNPIRYLPSVTPRAWLSSIFFYWLIQRSGSLWLLFLKKPATCNEKEWELVVPRFSLLTIVHVIFPRQQNFRRKFFVFSSTSCKFSLGETNRMIPPNTSLVKYDNPVLVSRNTDKKSPRVSWYLSNMASSRWPFTCWTVCFQVVPLEISSFAVLNIVKNSVIFTSKVFKKGYTRFLTS